jgi:hypothetical protein
VYYDDTRLQHQLCSLTDSGAYGKHTASLAWSVPGPGWQYEIPKQEQMQWYAKNLLTVCGWKAILYTLEEVRSLQHVATLTCPHKQLENLHGDWAPGPLDPCTVPDLGKVL